MKTRKFFKVYGAVDPVREAARMRPRPVGGLPHEVRSFQRAIERVLKDAEKVIGYGDKFDLEKPGQYSDYWKQGAKAAKGKAPGT